MAVKLFADSNRVSLRYIPESVSAWGVIPAGGNVREMRLTNSSIAVTKGTKVSSEIRADRMVSSIIETDAMSDGTVNFEWSAGSYDDFMQAFMLGTWTRPMTFDRWIGAIVSITANNTIKILGQDVRAYLTANRYIKTDGFINPVNNGYWSISGTSLSGSDTLITVTGTPFVVEAGSSTTKVMDANDVMILKNVAIRSGTGGHSSFDSNTTNAFASAIAAGQISVGQNLFFEGLGFESGTVLFNKVAEVGDAISVFDGVSTVKLTAGTDFAVGAVAADSAVNFAAAVNAARLLGHLNVSASVATATVTLKDLNSAGGSIVATSDVEETGTITFSGIATAGDVETIFDGVNTIAFTCVASAPTPYQFVPGITATATAQNLKAAIQNAINASALNVTVSGAAAILTLKAAGVAPTIVKTTDTGAVATVVNFSLDANFTVTNFSGGDASQRGVFKVTQVSNDEIYVTPAPSTNNNSTIGVTVKGSMLRNPGNIANIIPQSFSIETAYNDIGQYMTADGLRVDTFDLTINSGAIVTGTMAFKGKATVGGPTAILGAAPYVQLASTVTEVMNATTNVGAIKKNGVTLTTAIQQIQIKGAATLRNQMAVSSKFPHGIGTGRFALTGLLDAYFEDLDFWTNFLNHDTVSLEWNFVDIEKNSYVFTVPAIKLLTDPIGPGGIDQDIVEKMTWNGFRDPDTACMLQIDRFSSLSAV
jgi:hypothetical protein